MRTREKGFEPTNSTRSSSRSSSLGPTRCGFRDGERGAAVRECLGEPMSFLHLIPRNQPQADQTGTGASRTGSRPVSDRSEAGASDRLAAVRAMVDARFEEARNRVTGASVSQTPTFTRAPISARDPKGQASVASVDASLEWSQPSRPSSRNPSRMASRSASYHDLAELAEEEESAEMGARPSTPPTKQPNAEHVYAVIAAMKQNQQSEAKIKTPRQQALHYEAKSLVNWKCRNCSLSQAAHIGHTKLCPVTHEADASHGHISLGLGHMDYGGAQGCIGYREEGS